MKTMLTRKSLKAALLASTLSAVLMTGWTPVLSQPVEQVKPIQPIARSPRFVPSLAVFMIAYESLITGQTTANPELVKALKTVLDRTPGSRQTFSELLKLYKALPEQERIAMVGKELASATSKTKLSPTLVKGALFRKRVARDPNSVNTLTKVPPAQVMQRPDNRKPAAERNSFEATHPDNPFGLRANGRDLLKLGVEPIEPQGKGSVKSSSLLKPGGMTSAMASPEPQLTPISKYRVAYKGLFCSDEGDDWGSACEPYAIFLMSQAGKTWAIKSGPYDDTDSGEKKYRDISLRSSSPLFSPLYITTVVLENDSWNPDWVVNAIQAGGDLACLYYTGSDCPEQLQSIVEDVLDWFFNLLMNDDDQVGDAITYTLDYKYGAAHTGYKTEKGFAYDYWQLFDGNSYRFWLAYDVQKL